MVEVNLNYHVLDGLAIPRPEPSDGRRRRIVDLAGRLAAVDDRYREWAEEIGVDFAIPVIAEDREEMLAEVDALVGHLYGLSREELIHVFETFHPTWNFRPRLIGCFHISTQLG